MDNKVDETRKKTGGRKLGVPNKATQEAREAVKAILDSNLPFIQSWIQSTADGIYDDQAGKWIVQPNPAKACEIVQNLVEYSVPKLARTEVVGDEKAPQRVLPAVDKYTQKYGHDEEYHGVQEGPAVGNGLGEDDYAQGLVHDVGQQRTQQYEAVVYP